MQTYAFAKDFSHFYLWTVKRLQKAVRANSPHLRQFANRAPSSLILTIQQTTSPLNSHGDPNFQQLNSIYILRKRLQETALTPLHEESLRTHRVQENSWLAYSTPNCWNYFGWHSLWLCHMKGEAGREQARTNMVCSTQAGPGMGSTRLLNIRVHQQFPPQDGNAATEVATLTRSNQKERETGAGREGPLLPSKGNSACPLPLSSSLKRLPCPHKARSVRSINEDLRKKVSNQLIP